MKHIDEQTLELLVLADIKAKKHERQIRKHLAGCVGCANIHAEIRDYYENIRLEGSDAPSLKTVMAQRSHVRNRGGLEPYFAPPETEVVKYTEVRSPSVWQRVGRYGSQHPVITSTFAFAVLAAAITLYSVFAVSRGNIGYYYYNTSGHRLEAYSVSNKLLWALPAFNLPQTTNAGNRMNTTLTTVADLGNNGKNDIVTVMSIGDEAPRAGIKVIDSRGDVVKKFTFGNLNVAYRGVHYDTPFGPVAIFKEHMPDGKLNLFVTGNDVRSPTFLARLDSHLRVIGKYWHYGSINAYPVDGYDGSPKEIVVTGCHDVDDIEGKDYDFMSILDPSKLVGDQESSATPGFGLKTSSAELYYVRFPLTDLERATGKRLTVALEREPRDSVLYVGLTSDANMAAPKAFGFDYVFRRKDMSVREVKFIMPAVRTYAEFKREGKVHGTFDERYLENLKDGVRYWDGKEWVKKATRIRHLPDERKSAEVRRQK